MTTETKTHNLSFNASDFERRFQEEKVRLAAEREASLRELNNGKQELGDGVLDGVRRKWIGLVAVGAVAASIGGYSIGKTTIGEAGSQKAPNTATMLERAHQNQVANIANAKQSGEPLITNNK